MERLISLIFLAIFPAITILPSPVCAKVKGKIERTLKFPDANDSIMTIESAITGLVMQDEKIFLFVKDKPIIIVTPYHKSGKTREEKFGKLTDSLRKPLPFPFNITGGTSLEGRILLLDGVDLRIVNFATTDDSVVSFQTFPWDTVKPAADSRGEPPQDEISRVKLGFKTAYNKVIFTKFIGFSAIPTNWYPKKNWSSYLTSSRLPGFPLEIISCPKADPSQCFVDRVCNLEGAKILPTESISGVAVSKKRKMVLVADSLQNKIKVFKFSSCFHLPWIKDLILPPQILQMSNIYIDDDDNLWVTTQKPDEFQQASVFVWQEKEW